MRNHLITLACMLIAFIANAGIPVENTFCAEGFVFQIVNEQERYVVIPAPIDYPNGIDDTRLYHTQPVKRLVVPPEVTDPATGIKYSVLAAELTWCDAVEELVISQGIKEISAHDMSVKKVELPESVEYLNIRSMPLEELMLPASLKELCGDCLPAISYLDIKTLCVPESVKKLEVAIHWCDALSYIELPGVEYIEGSLSHLESLKKLVFSPKLSYVDGVEYTSPDEIWFPSDGNEYPWKIMTSSFAECHPKAIYCARTNPPVFDRDLAETFRPGIDNESWVMFGGSEHMKDIILYVRPECVGAYRATPNWGLMDIRPYDFTNGLPVAIADSNDVNGRSFDLSGRETNPSVAPSGIYIIDGEKRIIGH